MSIKIDDRAMLQKALRLLRRLDAGARWCPICGAEHCPLSTDPPQHRPGCELGEFDEVMRQAGV